MEIQNREPRASYRVAYILCLLLGWLGAHRYYLHRWGTGFLYTITLGLFGFGWLLDLITLPILVRERRDVEAGIPIPPEKAPWADDEESSWWNVLQLFLRIAILVFVPAITIVIAMSLGQYVIIALVFLILAFCLLLGSIGRGLYAFEDMASITQQVPLLPVAIGVVGRFQEHYSQHRARSVFFYLLYPVLGPLFMIFSPAARSEFRPFLSLFSLVVIGVLFQNIVSYYQTFPASFYGNSLQSGLFACVALAVGGIGLFFACVVPLVSSSFYLSLTGRGFSLRFCSALALLIAAASMIWAYSATSVTFRSALTVTEKLNHDRFRDQFDWLTQSFLIHEVEKPAKNRDEGVVSQFQDEMIDEVNSKLNAALHEYWPVEHGGQVIISHDATDWYRKFMECRLRPEEAEAFRILEIGPKDGTEKTWLAVQFHSDPIGIGGVMGEVVLLYVVSPEKTVYTKWSNLVAAEPWIDRAFTDVESDQIHNRFSPQKITAKRLIDDFDMGNLPRFGAWPAKTVAEPESN